LEYWSTDSLVETSEGTVVSKAVTRIVGIMVGGVAVGIHMGGIAVAVSIVVGSSVGQFVHKTIVLKHDSGMESSV